MLKKLLLPLILLSSLGLRAETIKTDVLVIGGGPSGVAAAIQCARSKVKTLLVEPGPWLGGSMTGGGMCVLDANRNQLSGIWAEFRKHITDYYRPRLGYDTSKYAVLRFEPSIGASVLKKMADTVKNLTVDLKTPWSDVKKDGDGWEVTITQNGENITVKTHVLIDATEMGDVAEKAGAKFWTGFESRTETGEQMAPDQASPQIEDLTWIAILRDYGKNVDQTIKKPEGYDASRYACLKGKNIKQMLAEGALINDKFMVKWTECGNQYPATADELSEKNRTEFYKKARLHTLGLVYYLQTELGYKNLGLSDEFGTPDRLPYLPFIREYRRAKGRLRLSANDIYEPYSNDLYRTAIAVGDVVQGGGLYINPTISTIKHLYTPPFSIPLGAVVLKDQENLFVTGPALSVTHLANGVTYRPETQMILGQGVGCAAAFCAFFKTTTAHLKVRLIQGELLDYKGYLLPFTDVTQSDHAFRAIQQVSATGLLKGVDVQQGNREVFNFQPDSIVTTAEVKPVLTEIYTRAFLWFNKEKPGEQFTVGNLLSFISEITLSDPDTFTTNMQKDWNRIYHFKGDFDPKKPITRREFAVLANRYLNPFARTVDLSGRMIN